MIRHMTRFLQNSLIVVFTVALFSGIYQNKEAYKEYRKLKNAEIHLQNKVDSLNNQIETMQSEIDNIRSSAVYAKKILKDKYHVTDDDETIIFFDE